VRHSKPVLERSILHGVDVGMHVLTNLQQICKYTNSDFTLSFRYCKDIIGSGTMSRTTTVGFFQQKNSKFESGYRSVPWCFFRMQMRHARHSMEPVRTRDACCW
jgi:hypothetical protein